MTGRHLLLLAALCLVIPACLPAIVVSPPPPPAYVGQVWVGFSTDDASTLRLDLEADGTGTGVLLKHRRREPFTVTSWTLKGNSLNLSIRFANEELREARLAGRFKTYLMTYNTAMMPEPERVHERDIPGRLELSFEGSLIRFGLWPEKELNDRLQRAATAD